MKHKAHRLFPHLRDSDRKMLLSGRVLKTTAAVTFSLLLSYDAALGEDSVQELEEMTVTARKREERLQEVPGSATVIKSQRIRDQGYFRNSRQIVDNVIGATFIEGAANDIAEPNIRGRARAVCPMWIRP